MKQDAQNSMKHVSLNVDLTVVFVIINNVGVVINAGVNANNRLIKTYAIKDLFGILVIVSANVINPVILVSIQTIKIVSAKKGQQIKQLSTALLKNVLKNIDETRLVEINTTECNSVENKCKHNSCTLYIVLFSVTFIVNIGIRSYFLYFHWYLKKDVICVKFGTHAQTI